jgi:hypothetical protein
VRLREIALWVVVAALGAALYREHRRVPELERDVLESAQIAATASESMVADWIVQAESHAKEVERHARDEIQELNNRREQKKGR